MKLSVLNHNRKHAIAIKVYIWNLKIYQSGNLKRNQWKIDFLHLSWEWISLKGLKNASNWFRHPTAATLLWIAWIHQMPSINIHRLCFSIFPKKCIFSEKKSYLWLCCVAFFINICSEYYSLWNDDGEFMWKK